MKEESRQDIFSYIIIYITIIIYIVIYLNLRGKNYTTIIF